MKSTFFSFNPSHGPMMNYRTNVNTHPEIVPPLEKRLTGQEESVHFEIQEQ